MDSSLYVQLARSKSEFEQAFRLLAEAMPSPRPEALWLLKQHALPSANIIIALHKGEVVGALSLLGENPFRLPIESRFKLDKLRDDLNGRIAEISVPGIHANWKDRSSLVAALYHFVICFGATYCHYDAFVTETFSEAGKSEMAALGFRDFTAAAATEAFWLDARLTPDYRRHISPSWKVDYRFPEQKFFLVAHQNMSAEVLNYLFNERTKVFADLNDLDLRVLKSVYDFGDYAAILPARALQLPFEKLPRHRRFPMNCDGFLCTKQGEKQHLLVVDVSRDGLKVKLEEPLVTGQVYALNISVGITKQSELIATVVWADSVSQMAGLQVTNADKHWQQLVAYLEKDFLQAA